MGQDQGTDGAPVTGTRDPEQIREDIEATRHELGDTVGALAEKTDVKLRAGQKVGETKASVAAKKDELLSRAKQASPDGATSAATSVSQKTRQHPLPLAVVGALALGFLAGRAASNR